MGNSSKKNIEPDPEDSDDSSIWEHIPQPSSRLDTDAVHLTSKTLMNSITPGDVIRLEHSEFDDYEKVSVTFLISDDILDCNKEIDLHQWAEEEQRKGNMEWKEKFIEAVTIIKNFRALKKLGFDKDSLIDKYSPFYNSSSKYVNKFRKTLYLICETLTKENESKFVINLKLHFSHRAMVLPSFHQMEQLFAELLAISYFEENNVDNIYKIFKEMGLESICNLLEGYYHKPSTSSNFHNINVSSVIISNNNLKKKGGSLNEVDNTLSNPQSASSKPTALSKASHAYNMNGEKFCLIINQESFYTETEKEYIHLLPKNYNKQLHEREGTERDAMCLKKSLEKKKFRVEISKNLRHWQVIRDLKETIRKLDNTTCSCFFVCILSHGDEGVIYGCNSCSVPVSEIIQIMCHPKLDDIPKVLILQSCQGTALQAVLNHDNDSLETDGPSTDARSTIKTSHFLLFYSSVSGFASVRDKNSGSWFIQSLCSAIDVFGDEEHFLDICIETNKTVRQKSWKRNGLECYMVPIIDTTFTKKLYLNGLKN